MQEEKITVYKHNIVLLSNQFQSAMQNIKVVNYIIVYCLLLLKIKKNHLPLFNDWQFK